MVKYRVRSEAAPGRIGQTCS